MSSGDKLLVPSTFPNAVVPRRKLITYNGVDAVAARRHCMSQVLQACPCTKPASSANPKLTKCCFV